MYCKTLALLLALSLLGSAALLGSTQQAEAKITQAPAVDLTFEALASPAGSNSSLPKLTHGADGKVYLTWVEQPERGTAVVRFSVFEQGAWSEGREIVRGQDLFVNWADFPSLCASANGALLAQWLRKDGSGHDYSAEFAISRDGGETWSAPRKLHDDLRFAEHGFVSVAPIDADTFGAIWLDGRGMVDTPKEESAMRLYFRTIKTSGELGQEQVLDSRVCDCCQTSLIVAEPGRLVAAYRDRDAKEVRDIAFVEFDGSKWSEPAVLHADDWVMPGCPVNGPALASTPSAMNALWFTGAGEAGGQVLFASRKSGRPGFGFPTRVDDGSPVGRVDLIACGDLTLASWMEHDEGAFAEWRLRTMGPNGARGQPLAIARISAGRESGFLRMTPLDDGCLVTWTSEEGGQQRVELGRVRTRP